MFLPGWLSNLNQRNPIVTPLTCHLQSYTWNIHPVSQLTLSHPELLVAVEMLSSVVLMNQAMDAGDRVALWRQLSSQVTGLSNVEDNYAQRLAERCTDEGRLWSRWLIWILYVPGTRMNWCVSRRQPESRAATIWHGMTFKPALTRSTSLCRRSTNVRPRTILGRKTTFV